MVVVHLFHPLTFNLFPSVHLKCDYCRYHVLRPCFCFVKSNNLCLWLDCLIHSHLVLLLIWWNLSALLLCFLYISCLFFFFFFLFGFFFPYLLISFALSEHFLMLISLTTFIIYYLRPFSY